MSSVAVPDTVICVELFRVTVIPLTPEYPLPSNGIYSLPEFTFYYLVTFYLVISESSIKSNNRAKKTAPLRFMNR